MSRSPTSPSQPPEDSAPLAASAVPSPAPGVPASHSENELEILARLLRIPFDRKSPQPADSIETLTA